MLQMFLAWRNYQTYQEARALAFAPPSYTGGYNDISPYMNTTTPPDYQEQPNPFQNAAPP